MRTRERGRPRCGRPNFSTALSFTSSGEGAMNCLRLGLVLLVVLLGSARLVQAAASDENPSTEKGKDAEKGKDEGHGKTTSRAGEGAFMGTIDVAIWTIVVFLGLYFILRSYAWGPIQEGLALRERKNLEAAE